MSEENNSKSFDGRQMPADVEAERCLLGGILRDPEVMGTAVMAISDDDFFYMERHQLIWNALCSLNKAVTPIDPVTLSAELTKMGKLDIVGGREYIFELMESVASSANVPWQLEHLRSKAVLRKLIRTSSDIIRQAMDPASTPDNVLQDAERDIFAIADNQVRNTLKSIDNFVAPLLERINNRREGGITGVPTGITELDELTNYRPFLSDEIGENALLSLRVTDRPIPSAEGWQEVYTDCLEADMPRIEIYRTDAEWLFRIAPTRDSELACAMRCTADFAEADVYLYIPFCRRQCGDASLCFPHGVVLYLAFPCFGHGAQRGGLSLPRPFRHGQEYAFLSVDEGLPRCLAAQRRQSCRPLVG